MLFYSSMALQHFVGPWPFFQFLNIYTVGRTTWTGDQPVARSLPTHRTTQTQNKRTQTSMPRVRIEPTIPVFQRTKTFHALDRAATVIGPTIKCQAWTSLGRNLSMYLCSTALVELWPLFQFLNLYRVGKTPWKGDQPVARSLPTHRTTQTQNKRPETTMPWVGFEPTTPAFERGEGSSCLRPRS
jgi:hypothetical protein